MHTSLTIRKVFEGVATRPEMYRMFNRHRGDPAMTEGDAQHPLCWRVVRDRRARQ